jgi:hypothetical protein
MASRIFNVITIKNENEKLTKKKIKFYKITDNSIDIENFY